MKKRFNGAIESTTSSPTRRIAASGAMSFENNRLSASNEAVNNALSNRRHVWYRASAPYDRIPLVDCLD